MQKKLTEKNTMKMMKKGVQNQELQLLDDNRNDDDGHHQVSTLDNDNIHPDDDDALELVSLEIKREFGFTSSNAIQLCYHILLAALIGITLRLVTFQDAILAADMTTTTTTSQTSFLISFGFTKALSNLVVGWTSDHYFGRKISHTVGWIAGVALGIMLVVLVSSSGGSHSGDNTTTTNSWTWYVVANILLGIQQGCTWTTNIFMWMDILGPTHQALASALSNSVGYMSSAISIYLAASLTPLKAFGVVLACSLVGLGVSFYLVIDTIPFVTKQVMMNQQHNNKQREQSARQCCERNDNDENIEEEMNSSINDNETTTTGFRKKSGYDLVESSFDGIIRSTNETTASSPSSFTKVLYQTCYNNKSTAVICVGGLMTNLTTSFAWGLVLIWGKQHGLLTAIQLANIGSTFTFSKAICMVISGYGSDYCRRRKLILIMGFLLIMLGLIITSLADTTTTSTTTASILTRRIYHYLLFGGILFGSGIGSVYCVLTGAMSDHTPAENRACAIGIYKLWRDSGYAVGGLFTGLVADYWSSSSSGSRPYIFRNTTWVVTALIGIYVILLLMCFYEEEEATTSSNRRRTRTILDKEKHNNVTDDNDDEEEFVMVESCQATLT